MLQMPRDLNLNRPVPLMFQAQIEGRGKVQYAGNVGPVEKWVKEWIKGCPQTEKALEQNLSEWQKKLAQIATPESPSPVFRDWSYTIRWRMVTNGGQDDSIIRPVIGAKGMPFFPGSSMKGAFLRVCPADKRRYYCGGETDTVNAKKQLKPGILRFHGGYPVDMEWAADQKRLVDVIHNQQERQVMDASTSSAKVQISLYKPTFKFGISSTKPLLDDEWKEIERIWKCALGRGIGLRTSAGYGYVDEVGQGDHLLHSVHLSGQGLMSTLLTGRTPEFRPNMFKAVLRGHTLRLLGGITHATNAKNLTQVLWGGVDDGATVGKVGIHFAEVKPVIEKIHTYNNFPMPTFNLKAGQLNLMQISQLSNEQATFLHKLIQFTLLLSGFSKSWRRVHHDLFYKSYFENDKPMIGCHWEFTKPSHELYIPVSAQMTEVTEFLDEIHDAAIAWLTAAGYSRNGLVCGWREAFHRQNVQVWGRVAQNMKDSLAVERLHDLRIKGKPLTGGLGEVGRIWHRMYPHFECANAGKPTRIGEEFIELLTIFPYSNDTENKQIQLITDDFIKLWGEDIV
jgi:CRISPR-associated protein Cmr6